MGSQPLLLERARGELQKRNTFGGIQKRKKESSFNVPTANPVESGWLSQTLFRREDAKKQKPPSWGDGDLPSNAEKEGICKRNHEEKRGKPNARAPSHNRKGGNLGKEGCVQVAGQIEPGGVKKKRPYWGLERNIVTTRNPQPVTGWQPTFGGGTRQGKG